MLVRDLITKLKLENPDSEVILQKDSEGNGYSPLADVDGQAIYVPDSSWSGEVYSTEWSADDMMMGEEEWEKLKQQPHCVVLSPIN